MTTELSEQKQSRREFIRGIIRYLILGGLGFTTGTLILKRASSEKCARLSVCQNCVYFKNCNLPQALKKLEQRVLGASPLDKLCQQKEQS